MLSPPWRTEHEHEKKQTRTKSIYCELHSKTNYSFLGAASHADELVARAVELGYGALAVTDENSLAGIVRAWGAARETQLRLIVGAELTFRDAPPLVVWANSRKGYGNLCRLLTTGRRRAPKGSCWLERDDLAGLDEGLLAGVMPGLAGERHPLAHLSPDHVDWEWFHESAKVTRQLQRNGVSRPAAEEGNCGGLLTGQHSRMDADGPDSRPSHFAWGAMDLNGREKELARGPDGSRRSATDSMPAQAAFPQSFCPQSSCPKNRPDPFFWKDLFGDRLWLLASLYRGVDDARRIEQLQALSRRTGIPLAAAGDVLYHDPARQPLHDVLTAIRRQTTVAEAGHLLQPNACRHLHPIAERLRQFAAIPEAIAAANEIAGRCGFRLDELRYEYPRELAPDGLTPLEHLTQLTWQGAASRWPDGVVDKVRRQIEAELGLIGELRYEPYFLTVWDIVRFARSRGILCQGRGSAANSAVCYALGVTSVDPTSTDLLFERFISRERNEAPDIDIDFEHERREEVLQYLYEKYGRERAGLAATVITYRTRSAVRDVGKALGLSLDRVDALARQVDGYQNADDLPVRCRAAGIDPESRTGAQLCHLVDQILGFPRHLSQHVGGMVMTEGRIDELVPVENAAMDGRTVIQWDKDDLEELGLLKVDCLCLGMLTAIRKCFDLIRQHWGRHLTLANIPQADVATYDMICAADTVGVFQIESRGQMSMLPRLKPRTWYDLVIEVAIVRPGPIQGNMVHPYLRRRNGEEAVVYPNEAIRAVLDRTLGVPLFQEQAMKLAVVAAGFTPGEADQLRRAMGAWRKTGVIEKFREKLMNGMRERGLTGEFAEAVFRQIRGFGEYGFPESHAASFALLVYVSAWLKRHYPAAFTASILNAQPMGFYAPAQLVSDARRHGVAVLPPDVNRSDWDCTLEGRQEVGGERREEDWYSNTPSLPPSHPADAVFPQPLGGEGPGKGGRECGTNGWSPATDSAANATHQTSLPSPRCSERGEGPGVRGPDGAVPLSLRLGLRQIAGLPESAAAQIVAERARNGTFRTIAEFTRRTGLGQGVIARLSRADAFASLDQDRRAAIWQALGQERKRVDQPLLAGTDDSDDAIAGLLPALEPADAIAADYRTFGLSLRGHPLGLHRARMDELGVTPASGLPQARDGRRVDVAGLVIMRQRPSTAKGITFVTLEDETGVVNLVVKPHVWERFRQTCRLSTAWLARGLLEHRSGVIHVVVTHIADLGASIKGSEAFRSRDFR